MLGFLVCVTFILGFFFPPLWFLTAIFLVGMSASGSGKSSKVREMTYQENVRWYKKHGVDYDEWMIKLNPHLPIPGKPNK